MTDIERKVLIITITSQIEAPGSAYLKDCWLDELEKLKIARSFDDADSVERIERYLRIQFDIWKGENDWCLPDALEQVPDEDKKTYLDRCYKASGYVS